MLIDDKREGYGIETHPDGRRYEGTFKNNLRDGYGKQWLSSGFRYEGGFKQDLCSGQGVLYWPGGYKACEGLWVFGEPVSYKTKCYNSYGAPVESYAKWRGLETEEASKEQDENLGGKDELQSNTSKKQSGFEPNTEGRNNVLNGVFKELTNDHSPLDKPIKYNHGSELLSAEEGIPGEALLTCSSWDQILKFYGKNKTKSDSKKRHPL